MEAPHPAPKARRNSVHLIHSQADQIIRLRFLWPAGTWPWKPPSDSEFIESNIDVALMLSRCEIEGGHRVRTTSRATAHSHKCTRSGRSIPRKLQIKQSSQREGLCSSRPRFSFVSPDVVNS